MKKRTIVFFVISLVLVFGLVGPAAADAPETVTCWIPWFFSDGTFYRFPTEGKLVHTGQGFNLSCPYFFDFSDPEIASIEQACQFFGVPGLCTDTGSNFHLHGWGYGFPYNGEWYYLGDSSLHVNATGQVMLHSQYAPDQCSNGELVYSYTLEFPAGYWAPGEHTYELYWLDADGYLQVYTITFMVDANAPLLDSQVRLGLGSPYPIEVIHPEQDTFMQLTNIWIAAGAPLMNYYHDNDFVTFSWDGSEPLQIHAGPITNACTVYNPAFVQRTYGYAK